MTLDAYTWLASHTKEMEADLIELANQNSGSENLPGLLNVAQWLEDWVNIPGTHFERVHLPPRRFVDDNGKEEAIDAAPALRWDCRPNLSRRVLLAIHYDTVFGKSHSFQVCEKLSPERLNGPGVADAKGGIIVLRYALQAIERFGLAENCGWTILLNPDEEIGSPSSTPLFDQIAPDFDFGLLFEPALPTGELVSQRKGSGNFDLVVHGKSAHAGRHFEDGRNAITMLNRMLIQLDALNGKRDGTTINIGAIQGGGPVNIVPDLAIGRFNVRVQDNASADWFTGNLQAIVANADQQQGFRCKSFGGITSPPKIHNDEQTQMMRAVESSTLSVNEPEVRWRSTGGVCDGNKLAAAGLPNIDTLGPIGDGLHSAQEWVDLGSLPRKSKVIVNLIHRFSTGELDELSRRQSSD